MAWVLHLPRSLDSPKQFLRVDLLFKMFTQRRLYCVPTKYVFVMTIQIRSTRDSNLKTIQKCYRPKSWSICIWKLTETGTTAQLNVVVLGFNDTSTLVGHFVSSPREREKRDRRDSRRDEREDREERRKRNKSESEETEEIKTFPFYPYLLQG